MARGRFISKKIITDREVNALSDDTCRLAWTWLITIADAEGRTVGEPDLLKALLFPRRNDITADRMEKYIMEWANAGFILWYYGADNDRYIQLVSFEKHQVGLRKEKEGKSEIPTPEEVRNWYGVTPEKVGLSISRIENKEVKGECEVEVEGESDDDLPFQSLLDAFVDESKIPPFTGHAPTWVDSLKKLQEAGCTPDDIREGIRINKRKNYAMVTPKSILVTAIGAMSNRLSPAIAKETNEDRIERFFAHDK